MATDRNEEARRQITAERKGQSSLAKTLIGTATMMIGWGIGMKVSRGVSHLVNRKAGTLLYDWALNKQSKAHGFVRSVFNTAKRYASKEYPQDRAASIRGKLSDWRAAYNKMRNDTARAIGRIQDKYGEATSGFEQGRYFVNRSQKMMQEFGFNRVRKVPGMKKTSFNAVSHRDIRATTIAWNMKVVQNVPLLKKLHQIRASKALAPAGDLFAKARTSEFKLTGPKAAEAMKSRLYRYAVNTAAGAPLEYGMYRMTTPDKKDKWHDGSAIADWMKYKVAGDMLLGGGAMEGGKLAMNALKKKVVLPRGSAPFIHNVLDVAERISKSSFVTTLHAMTDDVKALNSPGSKPTSVSNIGEWASKMATSFRKHYDRVSKMDYRDRPTAATSALAASIDFMKRTQIYKNERTSTSMLKTIASHENIFKEMKNDPNTALNKVGWMFEKVGGIRGAKSIEAG
jgi:hypothetical protein